MYRLNILILNLFIFLSLPCLSLSMAGGAMESIFLDEEGKVWILGIGELSNLDNIKNTLVAKKIIMDQMPDIMAVAAGCSHAVLLDVEGKVWTFGDGRFGQLGHADNESIAMPKKIMMDGLPDIIAIAAGGTHTILLDIDGKVWTFGKNDYGQLGHGDCENKWVPTKIIMDELPGIIAFSAGFNHTVLVDIERNVWTFGHNYNGQLGQLDSELILKPSKILAAEFSDPIAIAAGGAHTILLDSENKVWTVGNAEDGQLGYATGKNKLVFGKILMDGLPDIIALAAGDYHTVILDEEGRVWTFGLGTNYQLGHADNKNKLVPTKISMEGLPKIIAIAAGNYHTLLLDEEGKVWIFGKGYHYLNFSNQELKLGPILVEGLPLIKFPLRGQPVKSSLSNR